MACSSCGSRSRGSSVPRNFSGGGGGSYNTPEGGSVNQFPIYNAQQQQILNKLLGLGAGRAGALLGRPGLPAAPQLRQIGQAPGLLPISPLYQGDKFSNFARNRFYGQTLPGLAERFTALGSSGRSGAFANQMAQRSGDFEAQLQDLERQRAFQELAAQNQQAQTQSGLRLQRYGQQGGFRQNANEQALRRYALLSQNRLAGRGQVLGGIGSLLQMGLQPRMNTFYQPPPPPQPSAWSQFAGGLGQGLGTLASAFGFGLI